MYLIDLFANIFAKKNYGVLIWLLINTVIVTFCFTVLIDIITGSVLDDWLEYLLGFIAYIGSMAIALSPVGEAVLRWQNGCKKITDEAILSRIGRLFEEVCEKSVEFDEGLDRNIQFYMRDDENPNAFATGRKTICITSGLLALSDDEIKGVLAHEFGHLSHKDTDVILVVAVGNMFVALAVSAISLIVRIFNWIIGLFISMFSSSERSGYIIGFLTSKFNGLVSLIFGAVMWLWTKLGVMICMSSSRQNEFHADKFAHDIGFGSELRNALVKLDGEDVSESKGLWAALIASHPDTSDRIEKLDSYAPVASYGFRTSSYAFESERKANNASEEKNGKQAMYRGFSSSFDNRTVKEEKETVIRSQNAVSTEKSELSLRFHKAYMYLFIPSSIIFGIIDLVTRGVNLSTYGANLGNIAVVIIDFAIVMFSVSALYELSKRQANAFVSIMVARVATIVQTFIAGAEAFDDYLMYGLDESLAYLIIISSIIWSAILTFLVYVYYEKRKNVLFDNYENKD